VETSLDIQVKCCIGNEAAGFVIYNIVMLFLFSCVITDLNSIYGVDSVPMFSTCPVGYPPPNFQTLAYQSGINDQIIDMKPPSTLHGGREVVRYTVQEPKTYMHIHYGHGSEGFSIQLG